MKDFKENSNYNYSTLNIDSINHSYDNTPCLKGISFDVAKNKFAQFSIFISCSILLTFFLYPSFLNNVVDTLFLN